MGDTEIDVLNFTLLVACLYVLFVFSHVPVESCVIADHVGLEHTTSTSQSLLYLLWMGRFYLLSGNPAVLLRIVIQILDYLEER